MIVGLEKLGWDSKRLEMNERMTYNIKEMQPGGVNKVSIKSLNASKECLMPDLSVKDIKLPAYGSY